jgi:ABC-type dipeptide/oligopeptide/nickel transport system permease component
MAWLTISAVAIIIFNLIAGILYGVLDPRVLRTTQGELLEGAK